jgi:hypothetical protein
MICSKHGLLTRPTLLDFLQEKLITIVPFSIALIAIVRYSDSILWPLVYISIIGTHMTHMFLKRCPHCAYYHEEARTLECLWWRWAPKVRRRRSGPPPRYLRFYTPIAIFTITCYPLYWLTSQWELLLLYVLAWGVLFLSIGTAACARCIDFKCKYNTVAKELREEYLSSKNR